MKKQIKSILLIISILLTLFLNLNESQVVYAKSDIIVANKNYTVVLGDETKNFTFVMPSSGYFYYTVTPIKYIVDGVISDSTTWYLPNTRMTVNYKLYEDTSVRYGEVFKSGAYSFKKGTKVKISLKDTNDSNRLAYYKLKVVTKVPKNFEKENNGSKKNATKITLNKTYTGISQQDEKDYWMFVVPKSGKYKISCVETNQGKTQVVKAYIGEKLISSVSMNSDDGWATLYSGKLKKGQKIYILLDNGSKDEFYKLKVKKYKNYY